MQDPFFTLLSLTHPDIKSCSYRDVAHYFSLSSDHDEGLRAAVHTHYQTHLTEKSRFLLTIACRWIGSEYPEIASLADRFLSGKRYDAVSMDFKHYVSPDPIIRSVGSGHVSWQLDALASLWKEPNGLPSVFGSFEFRQPQLEMAELVLNCFQEGCHAVIEAGTGTGKSLAYLIPSILWSKENETSVIVSTRTKHLQTQLIDKELASLKAVNMLDFSAIVVKGKDNYIDIRAFEQAFSGRLTGPDEPLLCLKLLAWVVHTKTGDLSELSGDLYAYALSFRFNRFSSVGKQGAFRSKCFVSRLRQEAKKADVVITNHALLLSDLLGESAILPATDYVVLDEAHTVSDVMTQQITLDWRANQVDEWVRLLTDSSEDTLVAALDHLARLLPASAGFSRAFLSDVLVPVTKVCEHQHALFDWLNTVCLALHSRGASRTQILSPSLLNEKEGLFQITVATLLEAVTHIRMQLDAFLYQLMGLDSPIFCQNELESVLGRLDEGITVLEALQLAGSSDRVSWVSLSSFGRMALHTAPILCGDRLKAVLFSKKKSVIMTSATITVGNSFEFFLSQCGLRTFSSDTGSLPVCLKQFESPFNYQNQAVFVGPSVGNGVSVGTFEKSYSASGVNSDLVRDIERYVMASSGGVLILMTSYYGAAQLASALVGRLPSDWRLLVQDERSNREALLAKFQENSAPTVLIGLDSFWEGVDIPGEALTCVIMPKLPFPVPTDPFVKARQDYLARQGQNGFMMYSLPLAVLKFKQGIGRLIRSASDFGQVIVLDERIYTKSYGRYFLSEVAQYGKEE